MGDPLVERFAALPVQIQSRLMGIVEAAGDLSESEIDGVRWHLFDLAGIQGLPPTTSAVLRAIASSALWVEVARQAAIKAAAERLTDLEG